MKLRLCAVNVHRPDVAGPLQASEVAEDMRMVAVVVDAVVEVDLEVEAAMAEVVATMDVEMTKELTFGRKMGLPF